jgi:hypothetical protein
VFSVFLEFGRIIYDYGLMLSFWLLICVFFFLIFWFNLEFFEHCFVLFLFFLYFLPDISVLILGIFFFGKTYNTVHLQKMGFAASTKSMTPRIKKKNCTKKI